MTVSLRAIVRSQARHLANVVGVSPTWLLGDSSKLDSLVGPGAHVATFAASFHWKRRLTVEEAVELQFTDSFSTPATFGERAREFGADARAAILTLHPGGYVTEPFRVEVLVATRP